MPQERPDYRDRITVDPNILVGKPVITGTRIPVSLILNLLEHGYDFDRVIEDYPILAHEDIKAALWYAQVRLDHDRVYAFQE
jgi:uncharacterized protein (DUF433 family)